jgi:hypothetical protein
VASPVPPVTSIKDLQSRIEANNGREMNSVVEDHVVDERDTMILQSSVGILVPPLSMLGKSGCSSCVSIEQAICDPLAH